MSNLNKLTPLNYFGRTINLVLLIGLSLVQVSQSLNDAEVTVDFSKDTSRLADRNISGVIEDKSDVLQSIPESWNVKLFFAAWF